MYCLFFFVRPINDILFKQKHTYLRARDLIVQQHIFVKPLVKVRIFYQIFINVIDQTRINFFGIGILGFQRKLCDIDPALGDQIRQVFLKADHLILFPCKISTVLFVDLVCHDHTVIFQHGNDRKLIHLIFQGKIIIGRGVGRKLGMQRIHHGSLLIQKRLIYCLFRIFGSIFLKITGIYYTIIK